MRLLQPTGIASTMQLRGQNSSSEQPRRLVAVAADFIRRREAVETCISRPAATAFHLVNISKSAYNTDEIAEHH